MLAVMQNFTQTAIAWVGLVGVRLGDFLPRKGDYGRGADGGGGGGLVRYSSPNIFTPNLGGWNPHTRPANLYT